MSSIGVRRLTVLGEFKPFGLIAEALDGKPPDTVTDKYEYFLFDPEIARDRDAEDNCDEVASALNNHGDHELFIRGNRIIWSIGARVFKRFTLRSPIVKLQSFQDMLAAVGQFGPNLKPPSYHDIRVPLLNKELAYTDELLQSQKEQWGKFGCSIMSDGWTDRKGRSIMNILVNCPAGTMFIKSIDVSDIVKTGQKIFELLDAFVDEIGEEKVVQLITDNGSNYVLAGELLQEKRPNLYWTPCAAHCIDLMLEDIGKLPRIKKTVQRAIFLVGFIYNHSSTLSLLGFFTNKRELVRHAVTRFATSFLTLERIHKEKANLRKMFVSNEWTNNKLSKEAKGKEATKIVLMPSFWNNIVYTLKVMAPLVRVLRLVDSEKKPAMGYIYEAMEKAKEAIMISFAMNESKYKDVFVIIDNRWNCQLHRPLHADGHFLNPELFYNNPSMEFDFEVTNGLYLCIERLVPDAEGRKKILAELPIYKAAGGMFGKEFAVSQRKTLAPAQWWRMYGQSAPNLQQLAIKILSLTCSASGCERNWSVFEQVCWCHLGHTAEALLCILQIDCLTIYNTSGEIVSVPRPRTIASIWPLPFGLLLQQEVEANTPSRVSFSSTSPLLSSRDMLPSASNHIQKGDGSLASSHLIFMDPLDEQQPTFIEERGKLNIMKEYDEKTIWTSDQVPFMASYNKGKMQHSLWVAEIINSNFDEAAPGLLNVDPMGVLPKHLSFRRIWQGKGALTAACKVFMATDDDAAPVVCFFHQEQRKLLSVSLQSVEINNEIVFDVKPDMSWIIAAVAASPVMVTRPRVKVGLLPYSDIMVLTPENVLLLYSGKQCLCRYILPPCLNKDMILHDLELPETSSLSNDLKITGLADAVEGRVNVIVNNKQMFRCALRQSPPSSLANDCITALAEGLGSSFYRHFLGLLWKDSDLADLSEAESSVDLEWDSFCRVIMKICRKPNSISQKSSGSVPHSAWDFLLSSQFHSNFCRVNSLFGISCAVPLNQPESNFSTSSIDGTQSSEKPFYTELLMECLESLHALYESLKLDNLRKRDLEHLVILLCNIADFLGEDNYLDHYIRDFPGFCKNFLKSGATISPKISPSLFRWLDNCLQYGCSYANISDLPSLVRKDGCSVVSLARKIVSFYSILSGANLLGKKLSSGVYCNITTGSHSSKEELVVLAMVGERFGLQQLDSLPSGVSLPLRHALDKCRDSPPNDWPAAAYILLGRQDLAMSTLARECKYKEIETPTNVNVISMSTPYMLNLHPVTISSTISDAIGLEGTKFEDTDSVDGSMTDGMEHIFNSSTQLRYGRDLRLNEVRRVLCSSRPVAIQTSVNHGASDQDLQQTQLWHLAQRTTSLPLGRGAFTLATIHTLLTEAFSVPKLVLAGRLPAQQNATVNLDPNIRNIQELRSWPEFHNAVAAGLRLAPLQGKMSRTWIIYNKPEEPNSVHAGLLLALGLHGFLRVLIIADIYQYFYQEHESTTVGLMLGLAASYRGTMQPAISKILYVHIPVRHPSSYPELEVPTLLQSAALMSVGILYEGSAHPQTMQVLLGEIGRRSGGDNVLEREGHAVSAGFALGLVALGRGEDALGFIGSFVNRLFLYIGGKVHNERSHLSTISMDESRGSSQMMDGTTVNIDVTAPGATIALALMFLKTESEAVASRLSIPNTCFDLQFVRPDFIMLRVIARNLIMWSRVHPSKDWVWSQIPEIVRCGVEGLGGDGNDIDDMDAEAFIQAYVNIVAGACISLGLVFAGTRNGNAQELLYEFAIYFLNEIKPVSPTSGKFLPKGLSRYIDRGTLETCLHLIVLSLSVVMAGSGHLQTFRLLRFLRSRNCADGQSSYGIQMAVSLAIGFLFLGGGMRTFSTNSSSVAALLITLYPRLPMGPNDNKCHLQAFRHLYVLATEARWIQTVDVDTGLPVYAPIEVTVRETEHYAESSFCEVTPCLLPERAILKTIRVCGPRYWPQVIDFAPEDWWNFGDKNNPFNSGILFIKRKVGACSYVDDPIGCQSLLSRAMHKVFGLTSLKASDTITDIHSGSGSITVDQLVGTFSSDPSLIAFAQFCCDPSWYNRSDVDFKEFCLQVLFECVSKDRPALLQVYLSLYATVESLVSQITTGAIVSGDSLSVSGFKLALTYIEALMTGKLSAPKGGIVQSTFVGSLRKRVEELLNSSQELKDDFHKYLKLGKWPDGDSQDTRLILLSWFLQWFDVPASSVIRTAIDRVKPKLMSSSSIPLLRLSFPRTHIDVISEIDRCFT